LMPPAALVTPWMPPLALARMVLTWLGVASTNSVTGQLASSTSETCADWATHQ